MKIKISAESSQWQAPDKIWNPMFFSIFFANMALGLGQQMSNSILAKYADALGAPASQIGMLMSMFAVTALAFRFVAGPAMDSFNCKYLVMGAMGMMAFAYIGFSLSSEIRTLMVFRLFQGIGNAFGNVCCLALVSQALPKDRFDIGMGYYSCAQVVSQAIGPTVGLQLVSWFGYNNTYIINACIMGVAVVLALQIKLPPRTPKRFSMKLKHIIAKEALPSASITFFIAMGFTTINSFLIVYASKRGVENGIGLFFTVYALTMLLTRPLVGKLIGKYGFVKVGIPAIIMTAVSLYMISISDVLWMFLIASFINAFGYGALQPALQSLAIKATPPERRGSASSTYFIGMDSATIIGPTIAGFVGEIAGYSVMWQVMLLPVILSAVTVLLFRNNINNMEKQFNAAAEKQS